MSVNLRTSGKFYYRKILKMTNDRREVIDNLKRVHVCNEVSIITILLLL